MIRDKISNWFFSLRRAAMFLSPWSLSKKLQCLTHREDLPRLPTAIALLTMDLWILIWTIMMRRFEILSRLFWSIFYLALLHRDWQLLFLLNGVSIPWSKRMPFHTFVTCSIGLFHQLYCCSFLKFCLQLCAESRFQKRIDWQWQTVHRHSSSQKLALQRVSRSECCGPYSCVLVLRGWPISYIPSLHKSNSWWAGETL
jgi:hypothetical protein